MKNKNLYTVISFILTAMLITSVIFLMFFAPKITGLYIQNKSADLQNSYTTIIWLIYAALTVALGALLTLLRLLQNVKDGIIFSSSTFVVMTALSLFCFAECTIFFALGFFFTLSSILSFAALFLGVLLLVVRFVLAEATEIKAENDYTV